MKIPKVLGSLLLGSAFGLSSAQAQDDPLHVEGKPPKVVPGVTFTPETPNPIFSSASRPAYNEFWDEPSWGERLTFITVAKKPEEELLGTTLQPVNPLVRAQIDLPEGQGLIVGGVEPNGAAARVGLRANDILLTLNDKPLAKFEDLAEVLKTSREGSVLTLSLLRKGKKETIEVKPISVVTLGPVTKVEMSYMIGISLGPVDEVLNDQFEGKLKGLVATEVIEGKPAQKAGIKAGDILVSIDGQPLATNQQLTEAIQASKGKMVGLAYRRGGIVTEVNVKPEARETRVADYQQAIRLYDLGIQAHPELYQHYKTALQLTIPADPIQVVKIGTADSRISSIEGEVKALRKQIEELEKLIKEQGKK